ncbi:hypothetical protein ebA5501 [Aromatoleum aromaticum EbN1]|uniref:Uncharacterized protein n=1 Tax=Aromatoleum aromaticum (strain DSM 19018 / LMG 30748 / EbN1) TaxID=76114 RepID=Q5P0A7_AROAE|nr:hypothetical protein ebA5501 [Aromatoleum aromaticum EbN1]
MWNIFRPPRSGHVGHAQVLDAVVKYIVIPATEHAVRPYAVVPSPGQLSACVAHALVLNDVLLAASIARAATLNCSGKGSRAGALARLDAPVQGAVAIVEDVAHFGGVQGIAHSHPLSAPCGAVHARLPAVNDGSRLTMLTASSAPGHLIGCPSWRSAIPRRCASLSASLLPSSPGSAASRRSARARRRDWPVRASSRRCAMRVRW